MASRNRELAVVRPRQLAMCLAVRLTNHSLTRIGQFFGGRDHTTVIHAINAAQARPEAQAVARKLTKRMIMPGGVA